MRPIDLSLEHVVRGGVATHPPAGNLLAIDDSVSAPALSHDWQYQYDGLGNMTRGNGRDFDQLDPLDVDWSGDDDPWTIDPGVAPHRRRRIRTAGSGVATVAAGLEEGGRLKAKSARQQIESLDVGRLTLSAFRLVPLLALGPRSPSRFRRA